MACAKKRSPEEHKGFFDAAEKIPQIAICVHDKNKLICIWLSREDQRNLAVQKELTQVFQKYRPMKNFVTVFYSSRENLEALIGYLLRCDRKALEKAKWNTV